MKGHFLCFVNGASLFLSGSYFLYFHDFSSINLDQCFYDWPVFGHFVCPFESLVPIFLCLRIRQTVRSYVSGAMFSNLYWLVAIAEFSGQKKSLFINFDDRCSTFVEPIITDVLKHLWCFLTLIVSLFFHPPTPFLSSEATMSERWPASILSQAYPHKTTASLSSTNSKSLCLYLRMPLGRIFLVLQQAVLLPTWRQHCTILHTVVLPSQFEVSFVQRYLC